VFKEPCNTGGIHPQAAKASTLEDHHTHKKDYWGNLLSIFGGIFTDI
jgi:hypothetical protein